jgi:hypothetical protein
LYGSASTRESILNNDKVEIVEVRNILRSGARCIRLGFFVSRDLKENLPKQFRRLRGNEFDLDAAGFRCVFPSLFQIELGNWTSFELVPALGGAAVGTSILDHPISAE